MNETVSSQNDGFFNPTTRRNLAISLTGELRVVEAIPALMKRLQPAGRQDSTVWNASTGIPASSALVQIGFPAIKPLLKRMAITGVSANQREIYHEGETCLQIIYLIVQDADITRLLIQREIDQTDDPKQKKNPQAALARFNDEKHLQFLEGYLRRINESKR